MNKKTIKIAGWALGLSLALGTGITIGIKPDAKMAKAESTTVSWSRVTSASTLTAGGTFIIGYEATANSGSIIPMANTGSMTTSAAGYIYSGSPAGNGNTGTLNMNSLAASSSSHEVTIGASSEVDGAVYIKLGDNFLGNENTKNNCKLFTSQSATTSFTPTFGTNDFVTLDIEANTADKAYRYLKYNTGSPRFAVYSTAPDNVVIYKKNTVTKYTVTYNANGGSGSMTDSNSPYISGASVTVLDNLFSAPDGKMFDHWNTASDDSGASYDPGQSFGISGDTTLYAQWTELAPALTLNYYSLSKYTIDDSVLLTATPVNFPAGDITYVWSSDDTEVAMVEDVSSASSNLSFVGRGTASIKVEAYQGDTSVPANKKAERICAVTVVKTRNVNEATQSKAIYDLSSITTNSERSSSDIANGKISTDFKSDPSITVTKAFGHANGGVRLATGSASGSMTFNFGSQKINHIKTYVFGWSDSEGSVSVTNYATNLEPASTTAKLFEFDLSADATSITFSCASGKRAIIKSIEFSYKSISNIAETADVVGLESFIDTYMHMDAEVDGQGMTGTNACLGWYGPAKNAFNGVSGAYMLNDHQRVLFATNAAYVVEKARLDAWAIANGDAGINASLYVLEANQKGVSAYTTSTRNGPLALVIAIGSVASIAIGGFFFISRKRHKEE